MKTKSLSVFASALRVVALTLFLNLIGSNQASAATYTRPTASTMEIFVWSAPSPNSPSWWSARTNFMAKLMGGVAIVNQPTNPVAFDWPVNNVAPWMYGTSTSASLWRGNFNPTATQLDPSAGTQFGNQLMFAFHYKSPTPFSLDKIQMVIRSFDHVGATNLLGQTVMIGNGISYSPVTVAIDTNGNLIQSGPASTLVYEIWYVGYGVSFRTETLQAQLGVASYINQQVNPVFGFEATVNILGATNNVVYTGSASISTTVSTVPTMVTLLQQVPLQLQISSGIAGEYVVEMSPGLLKTNTVWLPIATNTVANSGVAWVGLPPTTNTMGLFRVRRQ